MAAATTATTATTTTSSTSVAPSSAVASSFTKSKLKIRDASYGWLNFVALAYSIGADMVGLYLLWTYTNIWTLLGGLWLTFHGRVWAAYLVHEAAHATIFIPPVYNRWFGIVSLYASGCPYADFTHVKAMHMSHHNDRGDTIEFDHRTLLHDYAWLRYVTLTLEFLCVPAVETILHVRTAMWPLLMPHRVSSSRFYSAMIGTPLIVLFHAWIIMQGGFIKVYLPYMVAQAWVLQFLAINDAFQHTYEAILVKDILRDYTPGPANPAHTRQYEHDNTFSTLISTHYPFLNLIALNFGYHNAHHEKAMTPWYRLPQLHETLYGKPEEVVRPQEEKQAKTAGSAHVYSSSFGYYYSQLLPMAQLLYSWHQHRLARVMQHDYGEVKPVGEPQRAHDFVGAAGVSFLTV